MFTLTKPKYFIPVHGEACHLYQHAELAEEMGVPADNIVVSEIGSVVELTRNDIRLNGSVPSGSVMIDGNSVGEIGDVVLRDRKLLAEEGLFTVVILLKKKTGELAAPAEVISRGFVYLKSSEELVKEARALVTELAAQFQTAHRSEWSSIKTTSVRRLKAFV